MVSINWCLKQKSGIKIVEPNENISESYIKMAEDSIGTMNREKDKNIIFSVSAGYYSMYYSLYSILMRIGVKCEIHQCSIKFMEKFLDEFFSKEHINQINSAFKLRNITQYYVDKIIDKKEINNLLQNAPDFVEHSKNILSSINQDKINEIRNKLNE
jgi:uncharacterized protein (UPF0332 family)